MSQSKEIGTTLEQHESNSTVDSKENENNVEAIEDEEGNILSQYTEHEAMQMGRSYAKKYDLPDPELFARAAAAARSPKGYETMEFLSEEEKLQLNNEATKRWYVPRKLIFAVVMSSMAAALQGMDESVINGANLFLPLALGLDSGTMRDSWLLGLVNSSPYLCCALFSCWLTIPLNKKFGRKWTIFLCSFISIVCCIGSACVNKWWHLLIARFCLGIGIGAGSATVPIYMAECAPAKIRGALVMCWAYFTAFGITVGTLTGLMFYTVPAHGISNGLSWRLMLGSAFLPAVVVCTQVPFCPESPRWLMSKGRHQECYQSLISFRMHEILAARDCFYQFVLLEEESTFESVSFFRKMKEIFTVRRNRNAAIASNICMFMQQFCGINVGAYYSSTIFVESGFSITNALVIGFCFGVISLVFNFFSFFIIDSFGRRKMLMFSFPAMGCSLLLMGGAFFLDALTQKQARLWMVSWGYILFTISFVLGEGPVPFTYSAEAYPLYVRDLGMSFATAVCWFFNFVLAITWPSLLKAFTAQGAFGYYAAWNFVGFFLVLWFIPETKGLTLEELDEAFDIPIMKHAAYQNKALWNSIQRNIFRMDVDPLKPIHLQHKMAVTNPIWNDKAEVSHKE